MWRKNILKTVQDSEDQNKIVMDMGVIYTYPCLSKNAVDSGLNLRLSVKSGRGKGCLAEQWGWKWKDLFFCEKYFWKSGLENKTKTIEQLNQDHAQSDKENSFFLETAYVKWSTQTW